MLSLSGYFSIDQLNILLLITGLIINFVVMLTVKTHIKVRRKYFYLLNIIFLISFIIMIFTTNWLVFMVVWELISLSTALMLLWENRGLTNQYLIIQFLGSSILMFVILLAVKNAYPEIMPIKEFWLQCLFILGLGMKSAIFGLHFWLPPVHSQAPTPVSAILSGWVVKLGFIMYLKLIPGNNMLLILGFLMIFYGGYKALLASDFKVLLAYSSISQLGFIAIGIGSGTVYGYLGSIFHIIAHGIGKTGLFLAAGNFIKEYSSRSIYDYKDSWKRQTLSSLIILLGFTSLMGIPLLAGANSKYLIKHGFEEGFIFTILLYAASIMTSLYSVRFLYLGIFKDLLEKKIRDNYSVKKNYDLRKAEYLAFIVIAALLLFVGLNGELIISLIGNTEFKYNLFKGILEVIIYLFISISILIKGDWFKPDNKRLPSLDSLFNIVNKGLYKTSRILYIIIYHDFQYQLLWIPLFIVILFIFIYI